MPLIEFIMLWMLALTLLAAALTQASIYYAHWRGMFDHAGQRRSHAGTVPRGGGVAIILVMLAACVLLGIGDWLETPVLLRFALAATLVAAIGWLDDHRPLPALVRLCVHFVAAAVFVLPLMLDPMELGALVLACLLVFLIVTAINFWNFMDGINGIASMQAIFVSALLAHAFFAAGDAGAMLLTLALTAGCLGFLPFNMPKARVFLGDVGSGGIGFVMGGLLLLAVQRGAIDGWTALLLPLAFWLDAGLTLGARMVLGRRWYTAHREHLYQWLVRRGRSHAQVDLFYATWNLLIVLPAYALIASGLLPSLPVLSAVAVLGTLVWWTGRRQLLREARLYGFR